MTRIEIDALIHLLPPFAHGGHAPGQVRCTAEAVNAALGRPWGTECPPCVHPAARPIWWMVVEVAARAAYWTAIETMIVETVSAIEAGGFQL